MAGQLINRGDNTWYVRIFLGRDTATGKRKFHNKTIHGTKKDAQRYLHGVLRELDLGTYVEPCALTVNEYLDQWLITAAKPRVRPRTFDDYRKKLNEYIRVPLGARKLTALRPLDIQAVYSQLQERGLSARTIRYAHTVLSSALKQAVQWGLLSRNPCELVDLPKVQRKEMTALTLAQTKAFLTAAQGSRYSVLFQLAVATGMRPEEYLALKWSDLSMPAGTITIQRVLIRPKGGGWHFEPPKTSKSRRTLQLPPSLVTLLRQHRHQQLEERLQFGSYFQNQDFIFCAQNGQPLDAHNLNQRQLKSLCVQAGLPKTLSLYTLRHTAATLLLLQGTNPKIVSEQLGHASVSLTLDVYSHVTTDLQQVAAEKMEAALFG